jgi:hypothetical protein
MWGSPIRTDLVVPEPRLSSGHTDLPSDQGLGVELFEAAVAHYRTDLPAIR